MKIRIAQNCSGAVLFLALLFGAGRARAARPFVTDDARVVGDKRAQLETWLFIDREGIQHNAFPAFGPTGWLELTLGVTHGTAYSGPDLGYSITGPVFQAKALLADVQNDGWPGVAVVGGAVAPWGAGAFRPPGWDGFAFAATTASLGEERVLVHANLGFALAEDEGTRKLLVLGLGTQVRLVGGLRALGEIYSGDPQAVAGTQASAQLGARYVFSDNVQVDTTAGSSLTRAEDEAGNESEFDRWVTLGVRLVSNELF